MTPGIEARRLLRHCRSGALATLSLRLNAHPYASVVPFMSDFDGSPVLLISRLAEHTKNIEADARVSLLVHEPSADVQATARLTLVGTCSRIAADDALRERYARLFPEANDLLALDFDFHRIVPSTIRYIGGFGKIHWVEARSFLDTSGIDSGIENEWLDRVDELCRQGQLDETVAPVRIAALDCDGIDVRSAHGGIIRLAFSQSTTSRAEIPQALGTLFPRAKL